MNEKRLNEAKEMITEITKVCLAVAFIILIVGNAFIFFTKEPEEDKIILYANGDTYMEGGLMTSSAGGTLTLVPAEEQEIITCINITREESLTLKTKYECSKKCEDNWLAKYFEKIDYTDSVCCEIYFNNTYNPAPENECNRWIFSSDIFYDDDKYYNYYTDRKANYSTELVNRTQCHNKTHAWIDTCYRKIDLTEIDDFLIDGNMGIGYKVNKEEWRE